MSAPLEYVSMDSYCSCSSAKNKKAKLDDLAISQKTITGKKNSVIYVTEGRCPFCGHIFTINAIDLPSPDLTL